MPSICSAGMGPMSPAAMVIDPAADAVVWQMFASSSVNGRAGASAEKRAMLTPPEITLPPCAQPALSPNETFMALTTTPTHIPATTARALRGSFGPGPAIATREGVTSAPGHPPRNAFASAFRCYRDYKCSGLFGTRGYLERQRQCITGTCISTRPRCACKVL